MTEPAGDPFAGLDGIETSIKHYDINGEVISLREWVQKQETRMHGVAHDLVRSDRGLVEVSTILLGTDHRFWNPNNLPPLIFETMTFAEDEDYGYKQWRCATLAEAQQLHVAVADHFAQSWWLNLGGRA